MEPDHHLPNPTLEEVQSQFEAWRKARKRRTSIPAQLWKAAVGLAGHYSTTTIARILHLNFSELQHRIAQAAAHPEQAAAPIRPSTNFIEYAIPGPGRPECRITMENRRGDKMTIVLAGGDKPLDLHSLGMSFWSREP